MVCYPNRTRPRGRRFYPEIAALELATGEARIVEATGKRCDHCDGEIYGLAYHRGWDDGYVHLPTQCPDILRFYPCT